MALFRLRIGDSFYTVLKHSGRGMSPWATALSSHCSVILLSSPHATGTYAGTYPRLSTEQPAAPGPVRDFLRIDEEPANVMVFEFGSQKHPRYSDNAYRVLRESITPELVEQAWRERRRGGDR